MTVGRARVGVGDPAPFVVLPEPWLELRRSPTPRRFPGMCPSIAVLGGGSGSGGGSGDGDGDGSGDGANGNGSGNGNGDSADSAPIHERSPQRDHRLLEEAEESKFVKDYMLWNEGKLDAYAKRAYDA